MLTTVSLKPIKLFEEMTKLPQKVLVVKLFCLEHQLTESKENDDNFINSRELYAAGQLHI